MANLRSPLFMALCLCQLLALLQSQVSGYTFKVGDLSSWGIPSAANPKVYSYWSKYHSVRIGDSLLFLYPPSQDSVIQVTPQNFDSCNLKDPILYMNNGNSLFNITEEADLYFTSGEPGHCEKKQKLYIKVGNGSSASAYAPNYGPGGALADTAPSSPIAFGSIPVAPSTSSSSVVGARFSVILSAIVGSLVSGVMVRGIL
ncbi:unnamed protein product [Linum tenue]|uniref:Phytocyanin domain-containing protein n=1 Tax=Linum tenue TaxID=586396 RepID=A0AAV0M7K9_9ROSI|nr:unnamed protein product [Linum tenue]